MEVVAAEVMAEFRPLQNLHCFFLFVFIEFRIYSRCNEITVQTEKEIVAKSGEECRRVAKSARDILFSFEP